MEKSLVQDRLKFWYDQGTYMIRGDLWVRWFRVSLQHDSLLGKHGRHGRDGRGQGWVFCRSFMRTWLARRICESAGIAWIAIVFQVFSWTGGENAGATETAQEGKSEYELELYGGAEDSSSAYMSQDLFHHKWIFAFCANLWPKTSRTICQWGSSNPWSRQEKIWGKREKKTEETTCQWCTCICPKK